MHTVSLSPPPFRHIPHRRRSHLQSRQRKQSSHRLAANQVQKTGARGSTWVFHNHLSPHGTYDVGASFETLSQTPYFISCSTRRRCHVIVKCNLFLALCFVMAVSARTSTALSLGVSASVWIFCMKSCMLLLLCCLRFLVLLYHVSSLVRGLVQKANPLTSIVHASLQNPWEVSRQAGSAALRDAIFVKGARDSSKLTFFKRCPLLSSSHVFFVFLFLILSPHSFNSVSWSMLLLLVGSAHHLCLFLMHPRSHLVAYSATFISHRSLQL